MESSEEMKQAEREALTVNEVCGALKVGRRTVYRWIRDGLVEFYHTPGGSVRVYRDSLKRDRTEEQVGQSWRTKALT